MFFNIPVSGRLCMYCLVGLWSLLLLLLLQVYTSLHCVVNWFWSLCCFSVFWRAGTKHINVDTTHCRTLRKFHMNFFLFYCLIQIFSSPNVALLYQSVWAFSWLLPFQSTLHHCYIIDIVDQLISHQTFKGRYEKN